MRDELVIREIAADEFALVWPIFHAVVETGDTYAFEPTTTLEEARRIWAAPPTRAFAATLGDEVVGTYMLRPAQVGLGNHVANAGYMVAPAARGRGIARHMCQHSLDQARAAGFRAMQFGFVVSTNVRAVTLWQRCGFTTVGRIPQAFRHTSMGLVDVLIMYRTLADSPSVR